MRDYHRAVERALDFICNDEGDAHSLGSHGSLPVLARRGTPLAAHDGWGGAQQRVVSDEYGAAGEAPPSGAASHSGAASDDPGGIRADLTAGLTDGPEPLSRLSAASSASSSASTLNDINDDPASQVDPIPTDVKLAFFNETRHAYGRTALLLSGGAALGFYHAGELCRSGGGSLLRAVSLRA